MKTATAKVGWYNIDRGCAGFQEKYYLGYVLLEQLQMKVYVRFDSLQVQSFYFRLDQ